jgi:hypothetical protein
MELFLLYLWMKLDLLQMLFAVPLVSGCVGLVVMGITTLAADMDTDDFKKWLKPLLKVMLPLLFLLIVVPTQKQTAVLVAGHYALKAIETPEAAKIMGVLRKKANEYLDAELAESVKK